MKCLAQGLILSICLTNVFFITLNNNNKKSCPKPKKQGKKVELKPKSNLSLHYTQVVGCVKKDTWSSIEKLTLRLFPKLSEAAPEA